MSKSADERFWSKVNKDAGVVSSAVSTACWLWTANTTGATGYGRFYPGGDYGTRGVVAHRYSYETAVGPIPDGLQIDHLCCVKRCVNPAHLEPVTNAENSRRRGLHNQRMKIAALEKSKVGDDYICEFGHVMEQSHYAWPNCSICFKKYKTEWGSNKYHSDHAWRSSFLEKDRERYWKNKSGGKVTSSRDLLT